MGTDEGAGTLVAYHPLTHESGGDADSRLAEARDLIRMLEDHYEAMTTREQTFIEDMQAKDCVGCTVKQLFWLRDIKDKYL